MRSKLRSDWSKTTTVPLPVSTTKSSPAEAAIERPLRQGIDTFRAFVDAWYDGRLPSIIFHDAPPATIKRMISSVLAGYAWDTSNPFVSAARRRLSTLAELCGHVPVASGDSP